MRIPSLGARSLADYQSAGVEGGLQNKIDNFRQKSTKSRKVPLPAHRSLGQHRDRGSILFGSIGSTPGIEL